MKAHSLDTNKDFEDWLTANKGIDSDADLYIKLKEERDAMKTTILDGMEGSLKREFDKIKGYSTGVVDHPGGMAFVGEKGPELLNLRKGASVIPNNELTGGSNANNGGTIKHEGSVTLNVTGPGISRVIDMSDDDIKRLYNKIQSSVVHG